jgi:hypothetical protein
MTAPNYVQAVRTTNHCGLASALPDLQSVFQKPGAYEGRSLRVRVNWEPLRCFLTPADGFGFRGDEEVPPGPLVRRRSAL